MAISVVLYTWTDRGIRSISETTQCAEQVRQLVDRLSGVWSRSRARSAAVIW